jgi:glutamate--cysteine ligase
VPAPRPTLTPDDARRLVGERGFSRSPTPVDRRSDDRRSDDRRVGLELEWLTVDLAEPSRAADMDRDAAKSAGALPGGSRVTFEPGGQIELSAPPLPLATACDALAADVDVLGSALGRADIGLAAVGLEPGPVRDRSVHTPRYDAMEAYFDASGPAGRTMMRSTAALQVNLDLGDDVETEHRWRAAHDLGPVLAAAFANSPFGERGPSGYHSTRLAVWSAIDHGRTTPARCTNGRGCRDAWTDYALSASVMLVRVSDEQAEPVLSPLPFAQWVEEGHRLGWPTPDDLEYHLTTLFPPVRPRGWLELRMIDALPTPWWRVAAAVAAVLVHDAPTRSVADSLGGTADLWVDASRHGLAHPVLAAAARACFTDALARMASAGVDAETIDASGEFIDRYVARGRTPADDQLDRWERTGIATPPLENAPLDSVSASA